MAEDFQYVVFCAGIFGIGCCTGNVYCSETDQAFARQRLFPGTVPGAMGYSAIGSVLCVADSAEREFQPGEFCFIEAGMDPGSY